MKKKLYLIGNENEIKEGHSKKFSFKKGTGILEGFVVRRNRKLYAYVNRCGHVSLPLDWGDNEFFSEDKKFLLCKNHGAVYLSETGYCISGPCVGFSLKKISVLRKKGKLFASNY